MSGGAWEYRHDIVAELATDMREWAERAAGDPVPLDIAEMIEMVCDRLSDIAKVCREIDWYASGDHGDDTTRGILSAWLGTVNAEDGGERG